MQSKKYVVRCTTAAKEEYLQNRIEKESNYLFKELFTQDRGKCFSRNYLFRNFVTKTSDSDKKSCSSLTNIEENLLSILIVCDITFFICVIYI